MKNILDFYDNKIVSVSAGETLEFNDINLDSGTKARIVHICTGRDGWEFTLDFSEFLNENLLINGQYGITYDDLINHRIWFYNVAKHPDLFPFDFHVE
jgi:hypothetical protein